jgi:TRAP-type C4-dicarboxylate transport system permease small subunit
MAGQDSGTFLETLDRLLERALFYLSAALLLIIAGMVIYAVTLRYVFNEPPLWADEAPRVFFLWMTYIGVAVATRRGQNIRVTHFIDKFAPLPRLMTEAGMHLLVLVMLAVLFWYNLPILELQSGGRMMSTKWSFVWPYAALSAGCVLMLFYQSRLMIRSIRTYRGRG